MISDQIQVRYDHNYMCVCKISDKDNGHDYGCRVRSRFNAFCAFRIIGSFIGSLNHCSSNSDAPPTPPFIVWTFRSFVSLQSASGRFRFLVPPSGMTCLSASHLRRHSRFSDNVPTKTLSYDSCVTITIHHYFTSL